jgi:preprotein translocase subunit SecG
MQTILNVLHLFLAIGLVALVLIQHGKGADAGAAFGSGASATVFGSRGSGNFLSRATAALATLFFVTSMALAYYASQVGEPQGLMDGVEAPAVPPPVAVDVQRDVPAIPGTTGGATDVPAVPGEVVRVDPAPQAPTPEEVPLKPGPASEVPNPALVPDVVGSPAASGEQGGN